MINLEKVRQGHSRFLAAHERVLSRTLEDAKDAGLSNVLRHPGFTPRDATRGLAASTTGKVVKTRTGGIVRLQNRKNYARAIEGGARPHTITASEGKTLRFRGRGGALVFRRTIKHPGNKPYRFLRRSTLAAARTFANDAAIRFAALARKFGQ